MPGRPVVRVVHLDGGALAALADGDHVTASRRSPVPIGPEITDPDWLGTWRLRRDQVRDDPASAAWVTGVVWDDGTSRTVGRAGFHGPPDGRGMVEVGYAVVPALRGRGYGGATLDALLVRAAHEPSVHVVRASISPGNVVSRHMVEARSFVCVGEQWDDEDGLELVYELETAAADR